MKPRPDVVVLMVRRVARQSVAAAGIWWRTLFCRSCELGVGFVTRPRSPGREPGDSGCENHPVIHAARRRVMSWFSSHRMAPGTRCHPESPGSRPGLFEGASGPEGRVVCKRAAARQANCGRMPQVRVHQSPRAPARGFLRERQARRAGLSGSGRRPAKRTAAGCSRFACTNLPGLPPGAFCAVRACQAESKTGGRATSKSGRATRTSCGWRRGSAAAPAVGSETAPRRPCGRPASCSRGS